ncbi:PREDICTED: histidine-rich glycoprotein [Merops nubicus]|uniref:histidine-rich glycoprotein n=1 Tax=Merops nubicus TaxID=57421 RepID=UPI0004F08524|nr:PREDICTED: histidine-rich glycoprotein [Merops nubicus]
MLLLVSAFYLTLLQCSNAQNKASFTPADCNAIERDAGVALDLVNRHRRDGYVLGLFRVADAHELHIGNSSILYLTLDVLETECLVLSRRHWESCEHSDLYSMDFGQCKIITHTSQLLKKPQLYGFNCTLSPVPPDLLECKDCPVKIEILEVTEQHTNIAEKALKKFNSEGNHTNYFNVDKVEKILKMTASRKGHVLEFSIRETNCSKSTQEADQALECDFLHDWHARVGFCKARIISEPDEPDGTDISCEIYQPWQHDYGQRCRYSNLGWPHRHPHHHCGHKHHHKHHHKHGCPRSSQSRPEDAEQNHSSNEERQYNYEGPALPPPHHGGPHHHLRCPHHCPPHPPHCGPHHHPPPSPHDGLHPPPQEQSEHPPSAPPPHDEPYHPPPSQEELHHLPSPPPLHDEPHHPPFDHHHGSHCPPPSPHRPHHHNPPSPHGSHCPPPPPHGPHHHHPPSHCGPHHPPTSGHSPHCHLPHHHYRHHCNKKSISGKCSPFQIPGAMYRIPVLNQQDSLTPPTANFPELFRSTPHSSSTNEGTPFTSPSLKEMLEALEFPDHPSQTKSCPGTPKLVLPNILPLFPHSSMAENSPA